MTEIDLGNGNKTIIDDESVPLISGYLWRKKYNGYVGAYERGRSRLTAKIVYIHRIILGITERSISVDHINGDPLDNRKQNLRLATQTQNNANQRNQEGCSSKYKGVSFNKEKNKWNAYINCNHKRYRLGYFNSEFMAAITYDKMAKLLFGEYARCNFNGWPHGFMDGC